MRHYPEMAKDVQGGPKANPTRAKARAKADESVIHAMAALAKKLGFHTPPVKTIIRQSPDHQIARAALLKARKPDHYYYDSGAFESLIKQITEHAEQEITRLVNKPEYPEHISRRPLPAEGQEGIAGELIVDRTKLIVEVGEEVHQEDQVARERADALTQLQTPGAREDPRPVTELPADLPSLITRLREEGSQLGDESVIPDNIGMQELPELKPATVDNLDGVGGETAAGVVKPGLSQQETERHRADLPNPEQAQRQAVEEDPGRLTLEVPDPLRPGSMPAGLSSDVPPERRVTVTFYVYERQAWKKMDMVTVSPTQLAEAQIITE
ncbi:hypothetical protein ASPVEDRAFT_84579 [Aspergillus versicolor CBS 583.65]|uniref:Uncharacterized protein n=1 Tax=Aspergillus versicolor CBS 583.65 TaxID=1036611 RepID=A0A1L9PNM5_ASPVE|nr:uncharacterized protein ASPVEDRAFT_84579 [Aspergillus versicolor CBS 583.65]OJJ03119.1 hypothetical protein ASPVEDRAFT_84579 [Aspergillus versicolor CBS 583.65]